MLEPLGSEGQERDCINSPIAQRSTGIHCHHNGRFVTFADGVLCQEHVFGSELSNRRV